MVVQLLITAGNASDENGANIISTDWDKQTWWTAAGFSGSVWDFSNINGTRLPTLRDAGGAQNPLIQ